MTDQERDGGANGSKDSFSEVLNSEFRWPTQGDDPLRRPDNWSRAVELPEHQVSRGIRIASGFMEAASLLAKLAISERTKWDLIFPALYCYRHSVETGLKWLLLAYAREFRTEFNKLHSSHDLQYLWQCLVKLLHESAGDADKEGIAAAGAIVLAFHKWDPGSFVFRYATNTKGEAVFLPANYIDVPNLIDVMDGFSNFLLSVDGQLDDAARNRESS